MIADTGVLRRSIEKKFGKITDELFLEALAVAKNDIRANLHRYGKRADYDYVYFVASCYLNMVISQGVYEN